jgi:hypothetical protein
MLGRARSADDVSAASLGDPNRQVPDAAAGPMDQHPLAGRHLSGVHQGLPCGQTRQRKRGGLGVARRESAHNGTTTGGSELSPGHVTARGRSDAGLLVRA